MRRRSAAWPGAVAAGILLAISCAALGQEEPAANDAPAILMPSQNEPAGFDDHAPGGESDAGGQALTSLQRQVIRFDFEEARLKPLEFPNNFYRYIATDQGFPPFGKLTLTNETAFAGDWSFQFSLDGGSQGARIPTGVIPVVPHGDYLVTAQVRTVGLRRARAQVAAWFTDAAGEIIPNSRAQSPRLQTNGAWQAISIPLRGEFVDATDLVISLELLQPGNLGGRAGDGSGPQLNDQSGSAWFDDVAVWHLPRIELSTPSPGNIILPSEPKVIELLVTDLTVEDLTAELRIFDIDGQIVGEHAHRSPRSTLPVELNLAGLPFGWYRAVVDVRNSQQIVGTRTLDFALVPPRTRQLMHRPESFAIDLPPIRDGAWTLAPEIIARIGVGRVLIGIDPAFSSEQRSLTPGLFLREGVEQLLNDRVQPTFVLHRVPETIAAAFNVNGDDVVPVFAGETRIWREYFHPLLIGFGQQVRGWQLGRTGSTSAMQHAQPAEAITAAGGSLASLVPAPAIGVPWSLDREIPSGIAADALNITVPFETPPASLPTLLHDESLSLSRATLTIQTAPDGLYSVREHLTDMILRTLHLWRAGARRLSLAAPVSWSSDGRASCSPRPELPVWRTLIEQLDGRDFAGQMNVGRGLQCWIFDGAGSDDSVLVAWNESAPPGQAVLNALLSDGTVTVSDAFGNQSHYEPQDGMHHIPVPRMPVFISGIDSALAQFRAGFAILPTFVPAQHRVHELTVTLVNPWDVAISGKLRFNGPGPDNATIAYETSPGAGGRWQFSPRVLEFDLRPGQTAELPINLIFDRSVLSERKWIDATAEIVASRDHVIPLRAELEIGLPDITLTPMWTIARNVQTGELDLVITQFVTNTGSEPATLDVYLAAPGVSQKRRSVANLGPGETAIRVFPISGGAAQLSGRQIRVGVSQREGTARLNMALDIPELGTSALAVQPGQ